jgi:hypothetical protein
MPPARIGTRFFLIAHQAESAPCTLMCGRKPSTSATVNRTSTFPAEFFSEAGCSARVLCSSLSSKTQYSFGLE